jgi:F420-dependent oxidoreductase-like protein
MSSSPVFGVFIPQGWKMEYAGYGTATDQWRRSVEIAQLAERVGLDSVWVYDHFHNVPKPAHESVFECWTMMAAISQVTSTIRLGQMVGCNLYRPPTLLAKITSTLDVISGGRLDWGIGAGWYENECRGYGYAFPTPKERIGMLREAVEIVTSMWTERETTYSGTYYQAHRANCDPKPLQNPRPPIWIGGGGEQLTLRVVAQHADWSNFGGSPAEFSHKRDVLKQHCEKVGRDESSIRKSWSPEIAIRESEDELRALQRTSVRRENYEEWKAGNLIGSRDEVTEKIGQYIEMGCSGFIPWCVDYPDTTTVDSFAEIARTFRQP